MESIIERFQNLQFSLRTRFVIIIIFFILALLATAIGTLAFRIEQSEAQRIRTELEQDFEKFNDPRFIFGNNFLFTLLMFIPIIGPIWGSFILFNTGIVLAVLGIAEGIPPILLYFLLFFTPILWLEFCAYSIAMAQSTIWFLQMLRQRSKKEAVRTCILITICALILSFSALIEWIMINMSLG
ncbi:MAG: hypothetical protein JSV51_00225 [Candidatus Bathyarchaeota archaeon]|nr:MAG: hypothetical protein JSV51_00225 [Candidatus Bathyarchaeota archaeon]